MKQDLDRKFNSYKEFYEDNKYIDIESYRDKVLEIYTYYDSSYIDFSVPPGWLKLVTNLHQKLKYMCGTYKIHQIKSKFGGLRYYASYQDSLYYDFFGDFENSKEVSISIFIDLIIYAESASLKTCEITGNYGELRNIGGWYVTLSEEAYQEIVSN